MPVIDMDGSMPKSPEDVDYGYEGCFGWIEGTLYLGERHHASMIAALIEKNAYNWETLPAAKQMWGWYEIEDLTNWDPYDEDDDGNPLPKPKAKVIGEIRFATDDAKQTYGVKTQVKLSFQEAYPWVTSWTLQKGIGFTTQKDYGARARRQYLDTDDDESIDNNY